MNARNYPRSIDCHGIDSRKASRRAELGFLGKLRAPFWEFLGGGCYFVGCELDHNNSSSCLAIFDFVVPMLLRWQLMIFIVISRWMWSALIGGCGLPLIFCFRKLEPEIQGKSTPSTPYFTTT